jgi:hypothetical protein
MRTIALGKFKRRSTPKKILGRLPARGGDHGRRALHPRELARAVVIAHQLGGRAGRGVQLPQRTFLLAVATR